MHANLRTMMLFFVLIVLFGIIGWVVGTYFFGDWMLGSLVFLGIAAAINIVSYFYSSKIVLWSYRAKIVTPAEAPRLHKIVQDICLKADMPMPKLAIVKTATPNAFATGRNKNNAVVAVTTSLLDILSDDEIKGVLSHEMAHVKDKDILIMSVAATIAGAISFAARMLWWNAMFGRSRDGNAWLLLIVAITVPIAALLLQLGISRGREYKADYEGSMIIQRPLSLARALEKLEDANKKRPIDRGNPASSSLFIVNPFRGQGIFNIFSTHPPIKERVRRLENLAQETGFLR
ncbi:MAG: zinc metalloprotease HtpX [Thermoplasmata archaeon]|nr:zinc metalloprotease HtpX [Thermoplasmata archaeon]